MENLLEIKDLTVSFGSGKERIEAVRGVSLSIAKGQTVCIVGESGCGKTVTALSILRLIPTPPGRIDSGELIFNGTDLMTLTESGMREVRGSRISMIFQEPISSLNPVFTVGDQIGEAIRVHDVMARGEVDARVVELLKLVRIPAPETRLGSYPHELSGGMCQRVMIAMALACEPELLIADEPTTALDVTIQSGILELLAELRERLGMSVLLITHDLGIVAEVADDVYVMYAGKIVERTNVRELFNSPRHPYTAGLINSLPSLKGERRTRLRAIGGVVPSFSELPPGCSFQDRCPMVIDACRAEDPPLTQFDDGHETACIRAADVSLRIG